MASRLKRTYNLSEDTVRTIKMLVRDRGVAVTQDSLIEEAVAQLARMVRDRDEAALWERAGKDSAFRRESDDLDRAFARDDREAWER